MMKSLFILSLPRSMSTLIYTCARQMLGLSGPGWTMDGEILNLDRMAHYRGPRFDEGAKFIRRDLEPELFSRLQDFLTQVAQPEGFAYKDVVNPFVLAGWPGLEQFCVLRIRRPIEDVAYSMLSQGWYYPQAAVQGNPPLQALIARQKLKFGNPDGGFKQSAFQPDENLARKVIRGLILAEQCLEKIPAITIEYDDLIWNEEELRRALLCLYPELEIRRLPYINEEFCYLREAVLDRRYSPGYEQIQAHTDAVRKEIYEPGP